MLDPERAHELAIMGLKLMPSPRVMPECDPALHVKFCGIDFVNPIGLAAGFDKNAEAAHKLFRFGFGYVEMGTVTPKAQSGNERPRVFRLTEDLAVINRLGFNNKGLAVFARNLQKAAAIAPPGARIGANIGMNRDAADPLLDIATGIESVYPAADYVTINISSPNTPGLRAWQEGDALSSLIATAHDTRRKIDANTSKPILFKFAPDLTYDQMEYIASVAVDRKIDGIILTNTTIDRPKGLESPFREQTGGLSGRPLFRPSTAALRQFYRFTKGAVPLIGVGGVSTAHDAYRKIKSGATLVQLYTGMIYRGHNIAAQICLELAELLRADGFVSISKAVGVESEQKFDDNM